MKKLLYPLTVKQKVSLPKNADILLWRDFISAGKRWKGAYIHHAASGDVAGAIEGTWTTASQQIKTVVDNVVFPAIDLILAVFFFAKLGTAYFDYRKHGQFEWAAPAILFACLVFTLTAPLYVWQILGM